MSDANVPAKRRRGSEEPALPTQQVDEVLASAYPAPTRQRATRLRTRSVVAKRKISITVTSDFAGKLDAIARLGRQFPGEYVEAKLGKTIDEAADRLVRKWTLASPPSPVSLDATSEAAA